MKRDDVNKGQLVVLKYPLKNDYKMNDLGWTNGYDCWVTLDGEVSVSKYHREDHRMIGRIVDFNEDKVTIEYCFEPYTWVADKIPHSLINVKYEDIENDRERINTYLKSNLGEKYIDTNRLCGHCH